MGCCNQREYHDDDDQRQKSRINSILDNDNFQVILKNCDLHIKTGEIMKGNSECIIIGSDYLLRNRNSFNISPEDEIIFINSLNQKNLKQISPDQAILIPVEFSKNEHIKAVLLIGVPIWKGGTQNEAQCLRQSLQNAFKTIIEANFKTVSISDVCSSKFGIPKQLAGEIFVSVTLDTIRNNPKFFTSINFVLQEEFSVAQFQLILDCEIQIQSRKVSVQQAGPSSSSYLNVIRQSMGIINNEKDRNKSLGNTDLINLHEKQIEISEIN